MAKTIVFCPTEDAAERMRRELANLNADMMKKYPDYVVRITANDKYGKSRLDYFISVSAPTPVIAVTSQLLSTGVDCKMVKLIVIDKWINSMTEFKQIIGRGTRLRADEGKTHFDVMDFRGVAHFFTDPDWDGPVEIIKDPTLPPPAAPGGSGTPATPTDRSPGPSWTPAAAGWRSSARPSPSMTRRQSSSGRKASWTTPRKISAAGTPPSTPSSAPGLRKEKGRHRRAAPRRIRHRPRRAEAVLRHDRGG